MSRVMLTGAEYEDYCQKKQDWRQRLLDFDIDPTSIGSTGAPARHSAELRPMTSVNGRNYRRAIMRSIAQGRADTVCENRENITGDASPLLTNRGDCNHQTPLFGIEKSPLNLDIMAKSKKSKSSARLLSSALSDSREFKEENTQFEYISSLNDYWSGKELSEIPDYFGGFDGGSVLMYYGRWFVPKKNLDDISDDGRRQTELFDISGAEKSQKDISVEEKIQGSSFPKNLEELRKEAKKKTPDFKIEENREWRYFSEELDVLKKRAQDHRGEFVYKEIGAEKWQVSSCGHSGGLKYNWVLSCGGIKIAIFGNPFKRENRNKPIVRAEIGWEPLSLYPFDKVLAKIERVLELLGFTIDRVQISRIDLQVTRVIPFTEVCKAHFENRIVSRMRNPNIDRCISSSEFETITWGTGDGQKDKKDKKGKERKVEVCIYNKTREAFKYKRFISPKEQDLYERFGPKAGGIPFDYKDMDPENPATFCLTRVEFRLFRPFLKAHDIDSPFDLLDALPRLIPYLTQDYFRVIKSSKTEDSHYYSSENADWWNKIKEAFIDVFVNGRNCEFPREKRQRISTFKEYIAQAGGCIAAALAVVPVQSLNKTKEKLVMTREQYISAFVQAAKIEAFNTYDSYVNRRQNFLGTIEGLDMSDVKDTIARQMAERQQREERRKQRAREDAELSREGVVRARVEERDYTLNEGEYECPEYVCVGDDRASLN